MAAALQDVQKTDQIRIGIGVRILDRLAYAGLRCEVDHGVELV